MKQMLNISTQWVLISGKVHCRTIFNVYTKKNNSDTILDKKKNPDQKGPI